MDAIHKDSLKCCCDADNCNDDAFVRECETKLELITINTTKTNASNHECFFGAEQHAHMKFECPISRELRPIKKQIFEFL